MKWTIFVNGWIIFFIHESWAVFTLAPTDFRYGLICVKLMIEVGRILDNEDLMAKIDIEKRINNLPHL